MVHLDVVKSSKLFQQRLRRNNYVTPKNYLDFINSYLKLLEEKDKYILALVSTELQALHWSEMLSSLAEITYFWFALLIVFTWLAMLCKFVFIKWFD